MDFQAGQGAFLSLIKSMDKDSMIPLLKWIQSAAGDLIKDGGKSDESDKVIHQIRHDLRQMVPISAMLPSEVISSPAVSDQSQELGKGHAAAVHVDGFLYNEEEVDELCEEGQMSRNYCADCGSHQVAPLTFISHSTSVTQLKYIFRYLLPNLDGKVLFDIGSRLGAVLYGAYLYSSATSIVGCEMNEDLCRVQLGIVEQYHLEDRIRVICADVMTQKEILEKADIIVLNNVFEYFLPANEQIRIWQFLRSTLTQRGTLIVMSPSIDESLRPLETGLDVSQWLQKEEIADRLIEANWNLFGCDESDDSDLNDLHLYSVL